MDFSLLAARRQQALRTRPFREWFLPDGTSWVQFYRSGGGYILRFPDLADFEIAGSDLEVNCHPVPDVSDDTSRHLFLNQVLPLVLSKQGKLVFHASAVEVGSAAVAFVAASGNGKSTLAASFATSGFSFLCDDGLVLEGGVDGFRVMPSHPSIRLWEDSQEALVGAGAKAMLPVQYTAKARLLAGDGMVYCDQPRPLKRAYFLGDGSACEPIIQGLSATDSLAEWVKHAFLLDLDEKPLLTSHFDRSILLASQPVGFLLDFPRRFDALASVRQAILEHMLDKGGTT